MSRAVNPGQNDVVPVAGHLFVRGGEDCLEMSRDIYGEQEDDGVEPEEITNSGSGERDPDDDPHSGTAEGVLAAIADRNKSDSQRGRNQLPDAPRCRRDTCDSQRHIDACSSGMGDSLHV